MQDSDAVLKLLPNQSLRKSVRSVPHRRPASPPRKSVDCNGRTNGSAGMSWFWVLLIVRNRRDHRHLNKGGIVHGGGGCFSADDLADRRGG